LEEIISRTQPRCLPCKVVRAQWNNGLEFGVLTMAKENCFAPGPLTRHIEIVTGIYFFVSWKVDYILRTARSFQQAWGNDISYTIWLNNPPTQDTADHDAEDAKAFCLAKRHLDLRHQTIMEKDSTQTPTTLRRLQVDNLIFVSPPMKTLSRCPVSWASRISHYSY